MQIRIEIDVKPEELRRFLGIPDVSGLQEDVVAFLREKVGAASDFDAASFVKQNLGSLRKNPAWRKLAARMRVEATAAPATTAESPAKSTPAKKKRRTAASSDRKKPAARRKSQ